MHDELVSQRGKILLYMIGFAIFAAIILSVGIWAISSALQDGRGDAMNNRANFVAKCKSVGGEIGGDKCYVNGAEVFSE